MSDSLNETEPRLGQPDAELAGRHKSPEFNEDLRWAINRNSVDAEFGIPDFVLADAISALLGGAAKVGWASIIETIASEPNKDGVNDE